IMHHHWYHFKIVPQRLIGSKTIRPTRHESCTCRSSYHTCFLKVQIFLSKTLRSWNIISIDEMNTEEVSMGTVSFDFKGEVVVVTGGSRGLGLEIAHAFGYAGAQVVITARREQWLTEDEKFLKGRALAVYGVTCDVADAFSVGKAVAA